MSSAWTRFNGPRSTRREFKEDAITAVEGRPWPRRLRALAAARTAEPSAEILSSGPTPDVLQTLSGLPDVLVRLAATLDRTGRRSRLTGRQTLVISNIRPARATCCQATLILTPSDLY